MEGAKSCKAAALKDKGEVELNQMPFSLREVFFYGANVVEKTAVIFIGGLMLHTHMEGMEKDMCINIHGVNEEPRCSKRRNYIWRKTSI